MVKTIEQLEADIEALHNVLQERGINSKKTTDIFGREVRSTACARKDACPSLRELHAHS